MSSRAKGLNPSLWFSFDVRLVLLDSGVVSRCTVLPVFRRTSCLDLQGATSTRCKDRSTRNALIIETEQIDELLIVTLRRGGIWFCPEDRGDRSSTAVKVLCYKSEGPWFDPSWCEWIFH